MRLDGGRTDLRPSAHEPELGTVCVSLSGLEGSLVGEFQVCMNCSVRIGSRNTSLSFCLAHVSETGPAEESYVPEERRQISLPLEPPELS